MSNRDYKPSPSQTSIQSLAAAYTDSDESDEDDDEVDNHRKRRHSQTKEERRSSTEKRRSNESKPNHRDFYEGDESVDFFIPPDPHMSVSPKKQFESPYIDDSPIGEEPPPPPPNNRSESPETPTPSGAIGSLMKKNSSVALVNYAAEEMEENGESSNVAQSVSVEEFRAVTDINIDDVSVETEMVETVVTIIGNNKESEDLDVDDYLERALDNPIGNKALEPVIPIPPAPSAICDPKLQVKIDRLLDRKMNEGYDPNAAIQRRKDFRNPSIYEKLIQHLEIDEIGSNFPKEVFDPHGFKACDFYEELAKAQKILMDKIEKDKQPLNKLMDRSVASNLALIEENKRKSRWGNTTGSNASLTHSLSSGSLPVSRPTPVSSTEKLKSAEKERHGSAEKTFGYKKPKVVL